MNATIIGIVQEIGKRVELEIVFMLNNGGLWKGRKLRNLKQREVLDAFDTDRKPVLTRDDLISLAVRAVVAAWLYDIS